MTAYSIPSGIKIKANNFGLRSNTRRFTSPFNQATQTVELLGARWFATYSTPKLTKAQAADVKAFLIKLRGGANTFYAYDPDGKTARGLVGTSPGTPLVNGASQTGNSLNIDGCGASKTNYVRAGDYFTVNGELKMITADANTNGSGQCTLAFEPSLRTAPADNAVITFATPTCEMMLIDDGQAQWDSDEFGLATITFSGVEKLT